MYKNETKKECGCLTKYTYLKTHYTSWTEITKLCEYHKQEKIRKERSEEIKKLERINYTEKINCDICNKFICYAYSGGDLNCNYFYCKECYKKHNKKS